MTFYICSEDIIAVTTQVCESNVQPFIGLPVSLVAVKAKGSASCLLQGHSFPKGNSLASISLRLYKQGKLNHNIKFPEPKMTDSNVLFCQINSTNSKIFNLE